MGYAPVPPRGWRGGTSCRQREEAFCLERNHWAKITQWEGRHEWYITRCQVPEEQQGNYGYNPGSSGHSFAFLDTDVCGRRTVCHPCSLRVKERKLIAGRANGWDSLCLTWIRVREGQVTDVHFLEREERWELQVVKGKRPKMNYCRAHLFFREFDMARVDSLQRWEKSEVQSNKLQFFKPLCIESPTLNHLDKHLVRRSIWTLVEMVNTTWGEALLINPLFNWWWHQ